MKINKESGFTLIGVMVAAGVASIISVAISQLILQQSSSISYLEDRLSKISLDNELKINFSYADTCKNTLNGKDILADQSLTTIFDTHNNPIISSTAGNYDNIKVKNIRLENVDVPTAPVETGVMKLVIEIERLRGPASSKDVKSLEYDLLVRTDSSSQIDDCTLMTPSGLASLSGSGAACGKSPEDTYKPPPCAYPTGSPLCPTAGGTDEYDHGDYYSKIVNAGREDGHPWNITSHYKCVDGSWLYAGQTGSSHAPIGMGRKFL